MNVNCTANELFAYHAICTSGPTSANSSTTGGALLPSDIPWPFAAFAFVVTVAPPALELLITRATRIGSAGTSSTGAPPPKLPLLSFGA